MAMMTTPGPEPDPIQALLDKTRDAVIVRPGETLIVGVSHDVALDELDWMGERLRAKLPGVAVLIVAGVEAMAVWRP
jgi:hypothetical protein